MLYSQFLFWGGGGCFFGQIFYSYFARYSFESVSNGSDFICCIV